MSARRGPLPAGVLDHVDVDQFEVAVRAAWGTKGALERRRLAERRAARARRREAAGREQAAAVPFAPQRLPAGPLLRQVELAGGDYKLGVRKGSAEKRALERARARGTLTMAAADHLAVRLLGLTPLELWGSAYDASHGKSVSRS